ncbi:unnamed protein product [Staurois parvus]|uniref:Transposase Tc1-like domain-containing protein n=1 Tax=Staurois parvus TaxID=386267 RepID=A0ABN9H5T2_9NEOB|nr:unnamed protein product [Staurois parvus]
MQTASTNICERMGRSLGLSEFKHGTVICCHLCNMSIHEISLLLNIPQSTVSGIIIKWKQLGTTTTQPQSGETHKMTEWAQRMLKRTVRRSRQLSPESIAKDLQTSCDLQISTTKVCRELHGMGFRGQEATSKSHITNCMQSVGCSGVKHTTNGEENGTCLTALCQV